MKKPIMEFKDDNQLNECAKDWIEKLRLTNWIITTSLCDSLDAEDGTAGDILLTPQKKVAEIRISNKIINDNAIIICKEKTLVHELLHCYISLYGSNDDIVKTTYSDNEHANLDIIARALIISKYNLPNNYFIKSK